MVGDVGPDRGDHAGEIHAQLGQAAVDGREQAHRNKYVGEVDAGYADRDLDLPRPWRNPFAGSQFQCLQIAGGADVQPHPVGVVACDDDVPFIGTQRAGQHAGRVPRTVAPGGLVFLGSTQQLRRQLFSIGAVIQVDLGGVQMRILGTDHAHQAAQSALLQVGHVAGHDGLGGAGHDKQLGDMA